MAKRSTPGSTRRSSESLANLPKASHLKTRTELDAEIDKILAQGSKAHRYEIANALGFRYPKKPPPSVVYPTDTNIYALTELVMDQRGKDPLSNQIQSTSVPHIKRCVAGGLLEVVDRRTLRLTPAGKAAVIERIKDDMGRDAGKRSTAAHPDPYYAKRDAENYEKRSATLAQPSRRCSQRGSFREMMRAKPEMEATSVCRRMREASNT